MPSIWAPDGNVKINIATTAGLEGSKWHGENDAPKEKRQSLGTAVMAPAEHRLAVMEIISHSWTLGDWKEIVSPWVCVDMYIHANTFSSLKANADENRLKSSQSASVDW